MCSHKGAKPALAKAEIERILRLVSAELGASVAPACVRRMATDDFEPDYFLQADL